MNRESKSQQQLNLATLRRIDPATIDVLGNSAHVAVYKFDDATKSWHRRDVEGSLFVFKRSEPPNYRMLVLNRLSTENLTEDVTSNLLVQLSGPYMIYRNHLGVTTGIWFYEENEKEKISNLLNSIIQEEVSRLPPAHDTNVAALAGLLTSIKEQAAAQPSPYPPQNYPNQPPHFSYPPSSQPPYPPPSQSPYPPPSSQPSYQQPPYPTPPQHYQHPPPMHHQPPPPHQSPFHSQPPPPQPPFDGYATSVPPPSSLPPPPSSNPQLPPGDVIANLISSLANQRPPSYPPGQPTNNPNYNPPPSGPNPSNSPKAPPKAFAYDANSPFPKLLSPSNLTAKTLLQQPPPSLALNPSLPLANLSSGLPSPSPSSSHPPPSLNGSSGSSGSAGSVGRETGDGRGGLGGSGGSLGGSGGVQKMTKQQLRQALLNLVQDDRFIDLVYSEYVNVQR